MTQHTDADAPDFEPAPFVPRWPDGTVKPQEFWTAHERGQVASVQRMIEVHREVMGRQARDRTVLKQEEPDVPA